VASLRKLNRRLHIWNRYARRTAWNPRNTRPAWLDPNTALSSGHTRAWDRRELERERRQCFRFYSIVDVRCCLAGNDGHAGPCVIRCEGCDGKSRCPECGGVDDLGCWYCGGTGTCPRGCDDGEIVLEQWTPARMVTEHAFVGRGLL
jgi:hypothetical protein